MGYIRSDCDFGRRIRRYLLTKSDSRRILNELEAAGLDPSLPPVACVEGLAIVAKEIILSDEHWRNIQGRQRPGSTQMKDRPAHFDSLSIEHVAYDPRHGRYAVIAHHPDFAPVPLNEPVPAFDFETDPFDRAKRARQTRVDNQARHRSQKGSHGPA